jgi:hypothetical protein
MMLRFVRIVLLMFVRIVWWNHGNVHSLGLVRRIADLLRNRQRNPGTMRIMYVNLDSTFIGMDKT